MTKIEFEGSAVFSPDEVYRYRLDRDFQRPGPVHAWIMLNPSTADAQVNDPTVRRCVGFSHAWGAGRLIVTNLYALRSTDPAALKTHPEPVGPENDAAILEAAREADLVIAAWGVFEGGRAEAVLERLTGAGITVHALGLTKAGLPRHPLYLKGDSEPVIFRQGRAVVSSSGSVRCPVCGEGWAPNPSGKCSDCAARAVIEWRERKNAPQHKGERAEERRARIARMGDRDYAALREGKTE